MAEYINRSDFIEAVKDIPRWGSVAAMFADGFPYADVDPVVHGRWEWFDEETGTPFTGPEGWRCSRCKHELTDDYNDPDYRPMLDFCPNCGAKMDGGMEND